jgi:hypothetical protein
MSDYGNPLHYSGDELAEAAADSILLRTDQLRGALLTTDDLDAIPDPVPIIDRMLYRDSLAWLHAKPGHGKSFIALDWAGSVANKLPWERHEIIDNGPVVYIWAEGAAGIRQRVRSWESVTGVTMEQVHFLPVAVQLLEDRDLASLLAILDELEPVLVVVDTQARCTVGAEENSGKDMGKLVSVCDRIRIATRACVLLVHHEPRNGENLRGHTTLEGAATSIFRASKDGANIKLDSTKQKDIDPEPTIYLRLTPTGDSAVISSQSAVGVAAELTQNEDRLLEVLRESFGSTGAPSSKLLKVSEMAESTFYRTLNRLVSKGLVRNIGTKRRTHYVPTAADHDE